MGVNAFKFPSTFGMFIVDLIIEEEIVINIEAFVEGCHNSIKIVYEL